MTKWICTTCGGTLEAIADKAWCSHKGTKFAGKFKVMKLVGPVNAEPDDEVEDDEPLTGVCTKIVRRDRGKLAAAVDGEARFVHEPCARPTNNGRCERHAA